MMNGNVDIFTIAETKLDSSFPTAQFEIKGYYSRASNNCTGPFNRTEGG